MNESLLQSITLDKSNTIMTQDQRMKSSQKVKVVGNIIGNYFHAGDNKVSRVELNLDMKPLNKK